jgi:hypothetical protein
MALIDNIELFKTVNQDCFNEGETVVPFSPDDDTISFYTNQMTNLSFSQHEIDEFCDWLKTLPPTLEVSHSNVERITTPLHITQKQDIINHARKYEHLDCVALIEDILDILDPETVQKIHYMVARRVYS